MTAFDKAAAEWDQNPQRLELHRTISEKIIDCFPLSKKWKILDFGCGTGLMSFLLADKLGQITCLDSSKGMIEELNKKLKLEGAPDNIKGLCYPLDENTFEPGSFDFLYTVLALHHIENAPEIIRILAGLIKSGGYIALIDLDKEDGSFHKNTETGVHHNGFEREYICRILESEGFKDISSETAAVREREMEDGSTRNFPLFLISARKN
jgi:ubiquinone/menaquinone biosynthesis C-methylase UbiE